jgi:Membrane-associating domain
MISQSIACIVRCTQLLFAIVVISLTGDIIANSYWNQVPRGAGNPPQINYPMFIGVWTLLSECYFLLTIFRPLPHKEIQQYVTAALDGLNAVFYVGAAIALAAAMNIHRCSNEDYISGNPVTVGAPDEGRRCREAQALTAFVWFNFALFSVTAFFAVRAVFLEKTGLGDMVETPSRRRENDPEARTGGPMIAVEEDEPREPTRNLFSFRHREVMNDGGPPIALPNDIAGDLGLHQTRTPVSEPEIADREGYNAYN